MRHRDPGGLSLSEMIEETARSTKPHTGNIDDCKVTRTSFRIPKAVLDELVPLARARDMSMGLMLNLLIDRHLREQGRPGHHKLASWYPAYALRKTTRDRSQRRG